MSEDLIKKLEATPAPARDLSYAVAFAVGWTRRDDVKHDFKWRSPGEQGEVYIVPPDFARSIDAAMTLIPKGWKPEQITWHRDGVKAVVSLWNGRDGEDYRTVDSEAETIYGAFCAAALKALAASRK